MRHQQKKIVRKMKKVMTFIVRKNVLLIVLFFLGFTCCVNAQSNDIYLLFEEQSPDMIKEKKPISFKTVYDYKFKMLSKGESYYKFVEKFIGKKWSDTQKRIANADDYIRFTTWELNNQKKISFSEIQSIDVKDIAWLRKYYAKHYYNVVTKKEVTFWAVRFEYDFDKIFIVQPDSTNKTATVTEVNYNLPISY